MDDNDRRMLLEHDQSIKELRDSMIQLQQDQKNMRERLDEFKDDIKGDMREMESRLKQSFDTLRSDIMATMKNARDAVPKWIGIVVTGLGVLMTIIGTTVTILGIMHGW